MLTWVPAGTRTTSARGAVSVKKQVGAGRHRREELDADQLEELDVQPVGHLVEPVQGHLGHPGEELDERDAGVGDVVVGPLRAEPVYPPLGLVDDVLKPAIVKIRRGKTHGAASSVGIV
nr:hypothetical protein GCM10020092_045280 [Actinoplanes digitatis]